MEGENTQWQRTEGQSTEGQVDIQAILDSINKLPTLKQKELLDILKKQELEEKMLAWDINAFREYIMKYCIKIENWKLHINLPNKWEFKEFNFECNIRDLRLFLNNEDSSENAKLGENFANLLFALPDYLKAYWTEIDEYEIQNRILNPILDDILGK